MMFDYPGTPTPNVCKTRQLSLSPEMKTVMRSRRMAAQLVKSS